MENTLQEGEDVFQDLQQLEQWLEEMKRNPENANLEALMQMMQQLEQRMNESLSEQEQTQQWLNSQNSQTPQQQQQQIPLSSLMEAMRELIRQQRFDEAQKLLDQLMTALNRQHLSWTRRACKLARIRGVNFTAAPRVFGLLCCRL